jgi:hypothetical protein
MTDTPEYVCDLEESQIPASEWIPTLKTNGDHYSGTTLEGESRDQQVIDAAGNTPTWLRRWIPVTWEENGHTITVFTLPDYFCVGTDVDFVYPSMNPVSAETLGAHIKAVLPTRKIVNQIYAAADKREEGHPMTPDQGYPYDDSMRYTSRWAINAAKIWESVNASPGIFLRGHKKVMVVSHGLEKKPSTKVPYQLYKLGFYGWSKSGQAPAQPLVNGSWAIQGPTVGGNMIAHEWWYDDYAHAAEFIHEDCVIDDVVMKVRDVTKDPELYKLVLDPPGWEYQGSPDKPLMFSSYHDLLP